MRILGALAERLSEARECDVGRTNGEGGGGDGGSETEDDYTSDEGEAGDDVAGVAFSGGSGNEELDWRRAIAAAAGGGGGGGGLRSSADSWLSLKGVGLDAAAALASDGAPSGIWGLGEALEEDPADAHDPLAQLGLEALVVQQLQALAAADPGFVRAAAGQLPPRLVRALQAALSQVPQQQHVAGRVT